MVLHGGSGTGTTADPFVLVEEITDDGPAILVDPRHARPASAMRRRRSASWASAAQDRDQPHQPRRGTRSSSSCARRWISPAPTGRPVLRPGDPSRRPFVVRSFRHREHDRRAARFAWCSPTGWWPGQQVTVTRRSPTTRRRTSSSSCSGARAPIAGPWPSAPTAAVEELRHDVGRGFDDRSWRDARQERLARSTPELEQPVQELAVRVELGRVAELAHLRLGIDRCGSADPCSGRAAPAPRRAAS